MSSMSIVHVAMWNIGALSWGMGPGRPGPTGAIWDAQCIEWHHTTTARRHDSPFPLPSLMTPRRRACLVRLLQLGLGRPHALRHGRLLLGMQLRRPRRLLRLAPLLLLLGEQRRRLALREVERAPLVVLQTTARHTTQGSSLAKRTKQSRSLAKRGGWRGWRI